MFEELIKRSYYAKKHMEAPLLAERIQYVQQWIDRGYPRSTVTSVAQYLLRIIEFIPLKTTKRTITIQEVETAADKWASYKSNHPQKRKSFSAKAKKSFMWYSIDWLKTMNCLEQLPEEKYPLLKKIFKRRFALQRHTRAPLLAERLLCLQYWADAGTVDGGLRCIAQYLLIIMKYLNFYELREVKLDEIEKAANLWATNEKIGKRKNSYSPASKARFIHESSEWMKMLGCLGKATKKIIPFEDYLVQYVAYMREDQGLSELTICSRVSIIQN